LKHLPWPPPHVAVFATQVFTVWSQHPPPPHQTPSQQGCPLPPQAAHLFVVALHASPETVQKFAPSPWPPGAPVQHVCPSPPHMPQAELRHTPRVGMPPQLWPWSMHSPSTQQRLFSHVPLWQHGWPPTPAPPQATTVPSRHTVFVVGDIPRARHVPLEQHPPPTHAVPLAQQGCPPQGPPSVVEPSPGASPPLASWPLASSPAASGEASLEPVSCPALSVPASGWLASDTLPSADASAAGS
jgi:hypothetical protein